MHKIIEPGILYFGTPVVLISTINEDGTYNLAPMSSAFWLGWRCMLGLARVRRPRKTCGAPGNVSEPSFRRYRRRREPPRLNHRVEPRAGGQDEQGVSARTQQKFDLPDLPRPRPRLSRPLGLLNVPCSSKLASRPSMASRDDDVNQKGSRQCFEVRCAEGSRRRAYPDGGRTRSN